MEKLDTFTKLAPYLTNPLVLVGFVVFAITGVVLAVLHSKLIPPLPKNKAFAALKLVLSFFFWISLFVIVGGFGLAYWKQSPESRRLGLREDRVSGLTATARGFCLRPQEFPSEVREQAIKACITAIEALATSAETPTVKEAIAELDRGNTDKAIAIFQRILDEKEAEGTAAIAEAAKAARNLGALAAYSDPKAAIRAYERAVRLVPSDFEAWQALGNIHYRTGNIDKALAAFRIELDLTEHSKNPLAMTRALNDVGMIHQVRSEFIRAISAHQQAQALAKSIGDKRGEAIALSHLGNAYGATQNFDRAEDAYKQSLELAEELKDDMGTMIGRGNLANIYNARGDVERAEKAYKEALETAKRLGEERVIMTANINLAGIEYNRRDLDSAERRLSEVIEIATKTNNAWFAGTAYRLFSLVLIRRGDKTKAEEMYNTSNKYFAEIKSTGHQERWVTFIDQKTGEIIRAPIIGGPPAKGPR